MAVSPQYIQEQAEFINQDLWEVVKYYFATNYSQYVIDDEVKTITLPDSEEPPHMFYYWTGSRNTPYTGKRAYGMAKDFKPAYGRITLTSILAKGILHEINCYSEGTIQAEADSCTICMYNVTLKRNNFYVKDYDILTGKTKDGRLLSEDECTKILSLPVGNYQENGNKRPYWLYTDRSPDRLDPRTEDDIKTRYIKEKEKSFDADIDLIKLKSNRKKSVLEQGTTDIRQQVKKLKEGTSLTSDHLEELKIQKHLNTLEKHLNTLEKDLKRQEENLFLTQMCIDIDAESEIDNLRGTDGITLKISQVFKITL